MSLYTRTVYTPGGHGLFLPDGKPAVGVEVIFSLVQAGTSRLISPWDAITLDRIEAVTSVITDSNGEFVVGLWANDRGSVATEYLCHIENGQTDFRASLPSSATPITWADFMAIGVPLTPAELSGLAAHIADHTVHLTPSPATASLYPRINPAGTDIEYTTGTTGNASIVTLEMGETLIKGTPVHVSANKLYAADNVTNFRVIGLMREDAALGLIGTAVTVGQLTLAGLTPGLPYFLGNGVITAIPPSNGHIVRIGQAVTTTEFSVNIEESILLV